MMNNLKMIYKMQRMNLTHLLNNSVLRTLKISITLKTKIKITTLAVMEKSKKKIK